MTLIALGLAFLGLAGALAGTLYYFCVEIRPQLTPWRQLLKEDSDFERRVLRELSSRRRAQVRRLARLGARNELPDVNFTARPIDATLKAIFGFSALALGTIAQMVAVFIQICLAWGSRN